MSETRLTPEMEALKGKLRGMWTAGDFGVIARSIEQGARDFVSRLELEPGVRVLDVACGTGNLALPAAKAGAEVVGIDIAPNLIEQATERARAEGVDAKFDVGDAEDMPYEDDSFDIVMTMFGAMFAPRPDVTASELIRVTKPGGLIAMANWTPDAFTGQMFKVGAKHVPPPPGMSPPLQWGMEDMVRERFGGDVSNLQMERVKINFHFDMPPVDVVEHFRQYFGPTQKQFEMLDEAGQNAMRNDLVELWESANKATDGTTEVESEYLEVRAIKV